MTVVAGVDPGLSGAIAFLDEISNQVAGVYDLPIHEWAPDEQRELNSEAFAEILERHNPRLIALELVQGFVHASSAFKLGASYGGIITRARASRFRLERVRPQVWQATIFPTWLGDKYDVDTKAASIFIASKAHPEANLIRKGKKPDHNRADSVCLAMYASRVFVPTIVDSNGERTRKAGK